MASAARDVAKRSMGPLNLTLRRVKMKDSQAFAGCAWRSPITGKVQLVGTEEAMNFTLVDIWTRTQITGTPAQLSQEKYVFKPQVLDKRTWIFQHALEARKQSADAGESAPCVREALAAKCLDIAGRKGGNGSPMMSYAFILPAVSLTTELRLIVAGTLTFMFTLLLAVKMNTPKWCNLARLVSLPVRLIFIIYLLTFLDLTALLSDGLVITILAIVIALSIGIHDIVRGDISIALSMSNAGHFEILRELPKSVFICRYSGPSAVVKDFKRGRNTLDDSISGMKTREVPEVCLVADVHGLLCLLEPMSSDDWEEICRYISNAGEEVRFAGVNLYSMNRQSLAHHDDPAAFVKDPSQHLLELRDGRVIQRKEVGEKADANERSSVRWGAMMVDTALA